MPDLLRKCHLEMNAFAHADNPKAYLDSDAGRAAYLIARASGKILGKSGPLTWAE